MKPTRWRSIFTAFNVPALLGLRRWIRRRVLRTNRPVNVTPKLLLSWPSSWRKANALHKCIMYLFPEFQ